MSVAAAPVTVIAKPPLVVSAVRLTSHAAAPAEAPCSSNTALTFTMPMRLRGEVSGSSRLMLPRPFMAGGAVGGGDSRGAEWQDMSGWVGKRKMQGKGKGREGVGAEKGKSR